MHIGWSSESLTDPHTEHQLHHPSPSSLPRQRTVVPLDLSGVDLSVSSGQKLKVDHKWTFFLVLKLALPVMLSIVRTARDC